MTDEDEGTKPSHTAIVVSDMSSQDTDTIEEGLTTEVSSYSIRVHVTQKVDL